MHNVKAIALDVDGVLTDGGLWWGPNGEEWKRFCFADVMGVSLARKAGLIVALISGEDSPLVDRFASKMGIADIDKNIVDFSFDLGTNRYLFEREQRADGLDVSTKCGGLYRYGSYLNPLVTRRRICPLAGNTTAAC